jgi:hypothetical protein
VIEFCALLDRPSIVDADRNVPRPDLWRNLYIYRAAAFVRRNDELAWVPAGWLFVDKWIPETESPA